MVNISPTLADTVVIIRPCVWIVCLLHTHGRTCLPACTRTRTCTASKNQLLCASIFISQWCHSKLTCAYVCVCVSHLHGNSGLAPPLIVMRVSSCLLAIRADSSPGDNKGRAIASTFHLQHHTGACLSTGRSPKVKRRVSVRATGAARHRFLFTQP